MTEQWWGEDPRRWSAGRWSLGLRGDELAAISVDGVPVLRSVRAVVRDRDWNTVALVVERVQEHDASLTLHVRSRGHGSSFVGTVRVHAADSTLTVACDLQTTRPFETNRTGLVVLHPPTVAGTTLSVTHTDGSEQSTTFPRAISPHQPVLDIGALRWTHAGLAVEVVFSGDVFEMEDQRNWTDASFKTYSRPLALPFPVQLAAGARITQAVRVTARRATPAPAAEGPAPQTDAVALITAGRFPEIAVGAATGADPAPEPRADDAVGSLPVLVELDLGWAGWPAALERAARSGGRLDVRLLLPSASKAREATVDALDRAVAALAHHDVSRLGAFWLDGDAAQLADREATALLRAALAHRGHHVAAATVIGGVRTHFTQLNREHHRLDDTVDGLAFSLTPLFHSTGTAQLIESLGIQRLVASQAVVLAAGVPVHIGPVTLHPRVNDVATTPAPSPATSELTRGYGAALVAPDDARQRSAPMAAWTIASAAALAVPGVASLAFFEEWGPRGIRDERGIPYPVAAAVRALSELSGQRLLYGGSRDGLLWVVGAVDDRGAATLLAANLGDTDRTITVLGARERTLAVPAQRWVRSVE
ncbi:hypothetical protein [Microbacterium laevaniformans]|uniref:hypothetical protein n=1 Tax=Microbacterium laevaniformans TaxID=36807 RepID=UPI003D973A19